MSDSLPTLALLGRTGPLALALAARFGIRGYRVFIGSRERCGAIASAAACNAAIGGENIAGESLEQAASAADIVILSVARRHRAETLMRLRRQLEGKILVDATWPAPHETSATPTPTLAQAKALLCASTRVVSAFQSMPIDRLSMLDQPVGSDLLVCGDDLDAREQIVRLADTIGIQAWHAGKLEDAAGVDALTGILGFMNRFYGTSRAGMHFIGLG